MYPIDVISVLKGLVSIYALKDVVGFSQEQGILRKCGFECPKGYMQIIG